MKPTPAGWPRFSSAVVYRDAAAAIDWLCDAFAPDRGETREKAAVSSTAELNTVVGR